MTKVEQGRLDDMRETFARNMEIKEKFDLGMSNAEIAKEFGMARAKIEHLRQDYDSIQDTLASRITVYESVNELFLEGYTLAEIGKEFNMSKQNVSRILKLSGTSRSDGGKSKKRLDYIRTIAEMTAENKTLSEIMEVTGLDESKIRIYAYQENILLISDMELRMEEVSVQVIKLRKKGVSQTEIAKRLDISQAYVSKILLNAGMRVRLPKSVYEDRDAKVEVAYREYPLDYPRGKMTKELADKFGLKEENMARIIRKIRKKDESKK